MCYQLTDIATTKKFDLNGCSFVVFGNQNGWTLTDPATGMILDNRLEWIPITPHQSQEHCTRPNLDSLLIDARVAVFKTFFAGRNPQPPGT